MLYTYNFHELKVKALHNTKHTCSFLWMNHQARLHGTITRAIRRGITSTHEDSVRFEPVQNVYGFRPNMTVVRYLNWTFRTSFFMVSLSACAAHFAITLLFAAAMVVIGHSKPDCIQVAGQPFSTTGGFLDAYALSWTTFSTVVCHDSLEKEKILLVTWLWIVTNNPFFS